jgi:hypothetical protein
MDRDSKLGGATPASRRSNSNIVVTRVTGFSPSLFMRRRAAKGLDRVVRLRPDARSRPPGKRGVA